MADKHNSDAEVSREQLIKLLNEALADGNNSARRLSQQVLDRLALG